MWVNCIGVIFAAAAMASAATVSVVVDAQSGPWLYTSGLNNHERYGIGDHSSPTIIDSSSGIGFVAGRNLSITYVSGLTSPYPGLPPYVDATGDAVLSGPVDANPGSTGRLSPSAYVNPAEYPIRLNALIGTFSDTNGAIIGTPFAVGNSRTVNVPLGATRLELGVNDDLYKDNTGALVIRVSSVPEPSTFVLATLAIATVVLMRLSRSARCE